MNKMGGLSCLFVSSKDGGSHTAEQYSRVGLTIGPRDV